MVEIRILLVRGLFVLVVVVVLVVLSEVGSVVGCLFGFEVNCVVRIVVCLRCDWERGVEVDVGDCVDFVVLIGGDGVVDIND